MTPHASSVGKTININIADNFSPFPGGRSAALGPHSGETFRRDYLVPAIRDAMENGGKVFVLLDGTRGYSASFLDEAFGGLIRDEGFNLNDLDGILSINNNIRRYDTYRNLALRYMKEAQEQNT